jgi:hypothetical protein
LFRYDVVPVANSPLDSERVATVRAETAAGNLMWGAMEAGIQGDKQYMAAMTTMAYALLASNATKLEAYRTQSNQHSSALADRLLHPVTSINPHVQPHLVEAEKQRLAANLLFARAAQYSGSSDPFFPMEGGLGKSTLGSQSPLDSLVTPYDPSTFGTAAAFLGLPPTQTGPAAASAAPAKSAPTTEHTDDRPTAPTEHAIAITVRTQQDDHHSRQRSYSEGGRRRDDRERDDRRNDRNNDRRNGNNAGKGVRFHNWSRKGNKGGWNGYSN